MIKKHLSWSDPPLKRIDLFKPFDGGNGLRETAARSLFIEKKLPLKIIQFHEIPVDDPDTPQTGPCKIIRGSRAKGAAADDHN